MGSKLKGAIKSTKKAIKSKKEAFKNKKEAIRGKIDSKKLAKLLKKKITDAFNSNDKFILDWYGKTTTTAKTEEKSGELTVVITLDTIPINPDIISKLANNAVNYINTANSSKFIWSKFEVTPSLSTEQQLTLTIRCETGIGPLY